jgi:hypothetical protein
MPRKVPRIRWRDGRLDLLLPNGIMNNPSRQGSEESLELSRCVEKRLGKRDERKGEDTLP